MSLTARKLAADELAGLATALRAAHLPADDLPADDQQDDDHHFFAFSQQGKLVGYAGAETWPGGALLRSVVVLPEYQGQGHGAAIISWMLNWLTGQGLSDLWLLTTSIEAMMTGFGFQTVSRDTAPPQVRASRQFSGLCPASAVLMRRPKA